MFKLMIVDDEAAIRKGLINFVAWDTLECEVAGEAANGQDAVENIKTAAPDIVICDVKMPGMNGIELAKYIHENYPQIKVVILTGYAEFSNAQAALKYGVVDFVLKPTEMEQLLEAVSKAKKEIVRQRQQESKLTTLEGRINGNLSELREKLIHDIIDGVVNHPGTVEDKCQEFGISMKEYYVLVYEIERENDKTAGANFKEDSQFISCVKNFLSMAFKDYRHIMVPVKRHRLCSVISFDDSSPDECMRIILNNAKEIFRIVEGFMKFSLSIGVSNRHTSLVELDRAYDEAVKALSERFYSDGDCGISIYSKYTNSLSNEEKILTNTYLANILRFVQDGDKDRSIALIAEMLEKLRAGKQPIEYIKNIGIHLCSSFDTLLSHYDMDITNCIQNGYSIYKDILESQSIRSLLEILTSAAGAISARLNSQDRQSNYIIKRAAAYIHQNYKKDINLQMLAGHVHINSSYLSRLFKKETGDNITDAIMKVRIEKAKELLQRSDLKTYEVASEVGIDDPAYFSVIFKKYTGVSPKDYKYSR